MPYFPMNTGFPTTQASKDAAASEGKSDGKSDGKSERKSDTPQLRPPASIQVKNRRKRYLEKHPEYFSADLEMAGPHALSSFCLSH